MKRAGAVRVWFEKYLEIRGLGHDEGCDDVDPQAQAAREEQHDRDQAHQRGIDAKIMRDATCPKTVAHAAPLMPQ